MSDFDLSNYPVLPAEPTGELREKHGGVQVGEDVLHASELFALSRITRATRAPHSLRPSWLSSVPASRSFRAPAALV